MRRLLVATVTVTLAIAGCGGGSDDDAGPDTAGDAPATEPAATEPAATEPAATEPAATEPPATQPSATEPAASEPPATEPGATGQPADGSVEVSLVEWQVIAPTELAAGTTTFNVSNDGDFRHHFGIARGDSYEALPLLPSGAIDEEALGDDYLGRTENLEFEGSATIEFDLAPGNYVFFCNIIAGPTSHAAQGQVLAVTVTE